MAKRNLFKGMLFEYNSIVLKNWCAIVMKKIALLTLFAIFTLSLSAFANRRDTSGRDTSALDTLHQQLKQATNDSLKAHIYTQLAGQYLNYDTISNVKTKLYYQNQALNYTL